MQLTDPRERDPQASVLKATWGQAEPLIALQVPPPSSLTKRAILVMLSGLTLLFCLPGTFSPRKPSASLTLFHSFIIPMSFPLNSITERPDLSSTISIVYEWPYMEYI